MGRSRDVDLRLQRVFYVDASFIFNLYKYRKLLKFQKGGCAICKVKPQGVSLAVDHNHDTGLLRGLLCFRCNRAYGLFHDNNVERLRAAADYLETPPFVKLFGKRFTAPGRLNTKKRTKLLEKMRANGH